MHEIDGLLFYCFEIIVSRALSTIYPNPCSNTTNNQLEELN